MIIYADLISNIAAPKMMTLMTSKVKIEMKEFHSRLMLSPNNFGNN